MQRGELQVLEHDAAVAVHDRLRQSRWCPTSTRSTADDRTARARSRARASPAVASFQSIASADRRGNARRAGTRMNSSHARQRARASAPRRRARSNDAPAEAIALRRDEHLRLDLAEAIDHARHAHVRSSTSDQTAPMLAVARNATTASTRVRQVSRHAIARRDAGVAQRCRRARPTRRSSSAQLDLLDAPRLVAGDDGGPRAAVAWRNTCST